MLNIARVAVAIVLLFTGCVGTKAGAYRVFAEDLKRLEGKSFNDANVFLIGHLANEKPVEIKRLENGNEIRAYRMRKERKQECTVLIEVNPLTGVIVDASSKGPDCWRPY
jgi:hypothetical protein